MGKFECAVCKESFENEEALEEHVKEEHPGSSGSADFECSYCGSLFNTKEELDSHISSAHQE